MKVLKYAPDCRVHPNAAGGHKSIGSQRADLVYRLLGAVIDKRRITKFLHVASFVVGEAAGVDVDNLFGKQALKSIDISVNHQAKSFIFERSGKREQNRIYDGFHKGFSWGVPDQGQWQVP